MWLCYHATKAVPYRTTGAVSETLIRCFAGFATTLDGLVTAQRQ